MEKCFKLIVANNKRNANNGVLFLPFKLVKETLIIMVNVNIVSVKNDSL